MSRARLSRSQYRQRRPTSFNGIRSTGPVQDAEINGTSVATTKITLTADRPILLAGVPNMTALPGPLQSIGAVQSNPTEIVVDFGASTAAVTALQLMQYDPAIRTPNGGWLRAGIQAVES